jgi:hypothetical protein
MKYANCDFLLIDNICYLLRYKYKSYNNPKLIEQVLDVKNFRTTYSANKNNKRQYISANNIGFI